MSVNSAHALAPDICMRMIDLESKNQSEEEITKMSDCIINEMVKRGIKPCDTKCLKKLTPEEKEKYFQNLHLQTDKIIAEEISRRKNEALNVSSNCLETIQLNPGEGMTYEDTANFVSCIQHEFRKRGLKECKDECYEKLSEAEKEKQADQFAKTFGEIIEGERARRSLQSLKLTKQSHRF
jgi:uncharacterized protein YajQ (UPF0234 family)